MHNHPAYLESGLPQGKEGREGWKETIPTDVRFSQDHMHTGDSSISTSSPAPVIATKTHGGFLRQFPNDKTNQKCSLGR